MQLSLYSGASTGKGYIAELRGMMLDNQEKRARGETRAG